MAEAKNEQSKPDARSIAGYAVNRKNQPLEFKLRGTFYRWEPAGQKGDAVGLTKEELESSDFTQRAKFFSVRKLKEEKK